MAFVVLLLVLGVVIGLAFFMVVLMGWALGPIEARRVIFFSYIFKIKLGLSLFLEDFLYERNRQLVYKRGVKVYRSVEK